MIWRILTPRNTRRRWRGSRAVAGGWGFNSLRGTAAGEGVKKSARAGASMRSCPYLRPPAPNGRVEGVFGAMARKQGISPVVSGLRECDRIGAGRRFVTPAILCEIFSHARERPFGAVTPLERRDEYYALFVLWGAGIFL